MVVGPEAQDPYRVNSWLSIVSERVFRHDILNEHLVVLVLVHRIASLKFPRGLRTSHRTLCEALWMFPFNVVENLKSLCNVIQCMCTVLVLVFFPNTFLHQLNSQNKPSRSVNCIIHCSRILSHSYVPKSTFIQYGGNQLTEVMLNSPFVSRVLTDKQSRTQTSQQCRSVLLTYFVT